MTDIKMDGSWQLTQAADGDAPTVTGGESLLQEIRLEAVTQEGELFYQEDFGWSLLDFIQQPESDLVKCEIENRIKKKLARYSEINIQTVQVECQFTGEGLNIIISFSFSDGYDMHRMAVSLNRTEVEIVND